MKLQHPKYRIKVIAILVALVAFVFACRKAVPLSDSEQNEWYSGGMQTVFISGSGAYGQPFPTLSKEKQELHELGDVGFGAIFNSDPKQRNYGLGPIFNHVSCASCHIGDGRGKAPETGEALGSLLLRISVPGTDPHGGPKPVPFYGGQLQQRSIFGAAAEADVTVSYTEKSYQFPDGESYALRTPVYTLSNYYTTGPGNMMVSARMAAPVFGLGLLEAINEMDILALQDINDQDGDGISGKANRVWDIEKNEMNLGRFGWKAGQPSLIQQSAAAYNQDMGITNRLFPEESSLGQTQGNLASSIQELSDSTLYAVAYYVKSLAVPGRRRANEPLIQQGKILFNQTGCNSCHVPSFRTAANMAFPELSNQLIYPYTDLLVHDMGNGLADNRPEFLANGTEWRTPPLWGIGLSKIVNGHNNFLHDGRARSLTEAIMWHGGEAEKAKSGFENLNTQERKALIAFLESL
ncbi:MAG: c-type cytochrome [Bacteroidetes bacterium]|nr:c-type cytochrome [Bacteroidota bacterium]